MPSEPRWLPAEAAIEFNRIAVRITGEPHHLLNLSSLESAVARPRNFFVYEGSADVAFLAATLLYGICSGHPFEQGNKRTAFMSCVAFIEINGYRFTAPDVMQTAAHVLLAVNHAITEGDTRDWLMERMRPAGG